MELMIKTAELTQDEYHFVMSCPLQSSLDIMHDNYWDIEPISISNI